MINTKCSTSGDRARLFRALPPRRRRFEDMKIEALRKWRSLRTLAAGVALAVLVGFAACANQIDGTEPGDEASPQRLAAQRDDGTDAHHHGRHFRGPARVVLETALQHGELTAKQREAVRAIGADLEVGDEAKQQMREKVRALAVDVVRSGSADSEQVEQAIDQVTEAIGRRMRASSAALKELHGTLDADQRAAVADKLRERIAEPWGGRHHGGHGKGFKRIAAHLMLTALQIDKLKFLREQLIGKRKRLRPTREELVALVDAFEGDDFHEALDQLTSQKSALLRERLSRAGEHTDTLLSLLGTEQRLLLAELIERGPHAVMRGDEHASISPSGDSAAPKGD